MAMYSGAFGPNVHYAPTVCVLPAAFDADAVPTRFLPCIELQFPDGMPAVPMDMQVETQAVSNLSTNFPPQQVMLPGGSTALPQYHEQSCGFFKIQLGGGPDNRLLFSDIRPGRFALGAQRYARVDACGWSGTSTRLVDTLIKVSLVPADGSGDYLTFTIPFSIDAAENLAFTNNVPPGAQMADIWGVSGQGAPLEIGVSDVVLVTTGGLVMRKDYLTPSFQPALHTPIPVAENAFNLINLGTVGCEGYVRFYCS